MHDTSTVSWIQRRGGGGGGDEAIEKIGNREKRQNRRYNYHSYNILQIKMILVRITIL